MATTSIRSRQAAGLAASHALNAFLERHVEVYLLGVCENSHHRKTSTQNPATTRTNVYTLKFEEPD